MADIEVKSYISNDGTKINRINYYSGSYYCISKYIGTTTEEITPKLDYIEIEEDGDLLFCQKNFFINNDVLCKIYFYMNFNGEVVGLAFSNLSDKYFTLNISSEDDSYPFETFDKEIEVFKHMYTEKLMRRFKKGTEISKRIALVKRVNTSES